ncbi:MAG: alpha/beta hydrolase [Xanthobacteraceae bacterium]
MLDQVKDAAREIADVRRKVAAMGPNFDEEILGATRALYAPLIRKPSASVKVTADVAYGSDPRQKLDVYQPAGSAEHVLVYIPGGGFVGGDKNLDGVFYVNLGNYFASHGILTIVANYRLAPAHAWPAGAQDVAGAVAWARANAKSYGGDPTRIVLFGQSAGSTHAATYLFDPSFQPSGQAGVAAGILMSGPYSFQGELRPNLKAYFGDDPSRYAERSPLTHVGKSRTPILLSVAEYDPAFLAMPTYELARAVTLRDGKSPSVAYFAGHNHVSTVMSFGTAQDDVGARVREFIASVG